MIEDPVVEETHRIRREIAAEYPDVHAFFEYLRERERRNPEMIVTLPPTHPESAVAAEKIEHK